VGGLVAFPTETVYGLGCDAFNARAVAKVFEAKNRPAFDPIIVHISEFAMLSWVAARVDALSKKIARAFWPGPLTLVLLRSARVPPLVTAGLETVAVRMPAHPIALKLISAAGTPLAAPSANIFGRLSPTTAAHVHAQLADKIDLIIDGGRCAVGVESTVVAVSGKKARVLRLGGLALEKLERVAGEVELQTRPQARPQAPGQLEKHYAPCTPVQLLRHAKTDLPKKNARVGLLAFTQPRDPSAYAAVEVLSQKADLCEAAANFFAALHRLDAQGLDVILAEPVPEVGLGRAIMDRLRKAQGQARA
jgi:L-threonylcarbamoyladenylate synthase